VDTDAWSGWIGQVVVVDTNSNFVYIGTLARVLEHFVELKDADAHDRGEGLSTKEQYVMESKRFGVKPNRKEVSIRKTSIVSVSRLEDILLY
jgi:small nuclear ribonucleoprotein (snRNP)-like protein